MSLNRSKRTLCAEQGRMHQRGLSIIELLVGVAIGLFIVGGAISLFVGQLDSSRRMLLEARLHQDLRAAADIVTRDLRRAGYWTTAVQGLTGQISNPNRDVTAAGTTITYSFDVPSAASQQVIFSLSEGRLRMKLGTGGSQDITDANVMTVTRFDIAERGNAIALDHLCSGDCGADGCPSVDIRRYDVTIAAQSVQDANIARTLVTSVRVRNDKLSGACSL